ncbi:ATP-grasp domain-containing protein [Glycomyces xiaoerkulensis]|uniref:ATP-grasp domain-containing protein n=1 Tax=Glycomyces xiaoerkulensis TaxID=2038139 RepID=UPI000C25664A|nr:ATP-grasp domain-containing protein [Glycomyces xiaoerkulensis]
MSEHRTIVVLGCTSIYPHGAHQLRCVREQAERRGIRLVGADTAAHLEQFDDALDGLETIAVDFSDHRGLAERAASAGADAVLTYKEAYVVLAAKVAKALGLKGNTPEAVERLRHKDRFRLHLAAHGFDQPRLALADSAEAALDIVDFAESETWIVKPRSESGSVGVAAVRDADQLRRACSGLEPPFIVEHFVSGDEYSVEGIFLNGRPVPLGITEKRVNHRFVETGHRIDADTLDTPFGKRASRTVADAMVASGLRHGAFHVELWKLGGQIILGEAHIRPGGDFIHLLLQASRPGLELYGLLMDDLLGRPTDPESIPPATRAAGIDYLDLPVGRVTAVGDWRSEARHPGLLDTCLDLSPGDTVEELTDSTQRRGHVAVAADTRTALDDDLPRLARLITETVRTALTLPPDPGGCHVPPPSGTAVARSPLRHKEAPCHVPR